MTNEPKAHSRWSATGQKQPLTSGCYRPFTTGEDVYEVKVALHSY